MKRRYNEKKYSSFLFALAAVIFILFSFSACQLFASYELEENHSETKNETNIINNGQEGIFTLVVNPQIESTSRSVTASRSAFPDFASELSNLEFYAVCESAFGEVQGSYDSTQGKITFTIRSPTFSNGTINFFARDASTHKNLMHAVKTGVNFTIKSTVALDTTIYFNKYAGTDEDPAPNGHINLTVSSASGSKIICHIYDSSETPVKVDGNVGSGEAVEISGSTDNARTIQTVTEGIAPGKYTAKILIYKDGSTNSNPDYREETINVWPGITTSRWYLSDGSKSQNLNIVPLPYVTYYVKGTTPSGPYVSGGISIDTTARQGSIKNPYDDISQAVVRCTSSTTDYRIIICGKMDNYVTIGDNIGARSITLEGVSSPEIDIIETTLENYYSLWIKRPSITVKNLQIRKGKYGGIYISQVSAGNILIEGCKLCQNEKYGGLCINNDSLCDVKVLNCEISGNSANQSGCAGGITVSGSGTLIIENTTISGNHGPGYAPAAGGIYTSAGTTIMKSVVISENSNTLGGGAIRVRGGTVKIGGSMYIPYGVTGDSGLETGIGKNDIKLTNTYSITITSPLTPPEEAGGIVGYIDPDGHSTAHQQMLYLDTGVTDTTLRKEVKKFGLIQDSANPGTTWAFTSTAGLQQVVEFAYPSSTNGSFNGSTGLSEVFKENRKIGNIKSIIASDHETTQGEYETYCKYFSGCEPTATIGKGDYYPVYKVSWYDAIIYCNLRSIDDGYEPVYMVNGRTNPATWNGIDGNYIEGFCAPASCSWDVTILADKNGWRLPTEIEWEYLARGGNVSDDEFDYSGDDDPNYVAWYGGDGGNSGGKVHPVKSLGANDYTLFDMSGNVWEWTNDWHSDATAWPWIPLDTPTSGSYPDKSNGCRVTKGGGYSGPVSQSPVANRGSSGPNTRNADLGFRVVRGAQYVGSKLPSVYKEVGDIVFNDGSAISYEDYNALSSAEQNTLKANAIAIIFYKGTGLNNSSDTTTVRTLGVGLKHNTSNGKWCINQINTYISQIQSTKNGDGESTTFTGDLNGSDNFSSVVNYSGLSESEVETTYPVFEFARNYNNTATNITGTQYEDGWFIPSVAELFQIYINGVSSGKMFDLNSASESLGGNKFYNALYWASSQSTTTKSFYDIQFPGSTYTFLVGWSPADIVSCRYCCIHEF